MNPLHSRLAEQLSSQIGVDFIELLEPISEQQPCGEDLRSNGVYQAIHEARKADDPTLPRGVWTHDLKKSNWQEVSDVAVNALKNKTKDLQISFWLLEAQIYQHKLSGIAPCILLLKELCEIYWQELHPRVVDDDLEYRTNAISWANEKLLPVLRLVPLTENPKQEKQFTWSDWELASRQEQFREQKNKGREKDPKALTTNDIIQAIALTATVFYEKNLLALADALMISEEFEHVLDQLCEGESPGILALRELLENLFDFIANVLEQRGVNIERLMQSTVAAADETAGKTDESGNPIDDTDDIHSGGGGGSSSGGSSGGPRRPLNSRSQAYAQLAEAADYLAGIEPHSPVPYLIRRAIQWGNLNTAELYQELFVQFQGQLNIFEVLGLEIQNK